MADTTNLQKSYSNLNERLATLFDESGVRRSFTVPYIEGQDMSDHIDAVGQAAQQSGGLTNNLLTTFHHASGKGWGTGDGSTVGHPGESLRNTIIPKDDDKAKAVIRAAQKHLDNIATFLGEDEPALKTAQGQLDLVKATDGAGMTMLDFGVMLTQIMYAPNQAIAKAHDQRKGGGMHPLPRPPRHGMATEPQGSDVSGPEPSISEGAPAPEAAPAAAPAAAAPAAPQAQG